eukprot:5213445-Amphidinium_carterae.1
MTSFKKGERSVQWQQLLASCWSLLVLTSGLAAGAEAIKGLDLARGSAHVRQKQPAESHSDQRHNLRLFSEEL